MNVKTLVQLILLSSALMMSSISQAQSRRIAQSSSSRSSRSSSSSATSYHVGLGVLNHNAGKASNSATSGDKPFFGQLYNQLDLAAYFAISNGWSIAPVFNLSIISKKSPEGEQKSSVSLVGVRSHQQFASSFDYHFGLGFIAYQIKGSGGTVLLNNGSGTTTFGTPSDATSSSQLYYDVGLGYTIQKFKINLSTLITEPFGGSKLALNPMLTFSMEIYK